MKIEYSTMHAKITIVKMRIKVLYLSCAILLNSMYICMYEVRCDSIVAKVIGTL